MAKLDSYFGAHTGNLSIYVDRAKLGTGAFSQFGPFAATFSGSYRFLWKSGAVDIHVELTNQNAGEVSGPCTITLNGQTDNAAKYQTGNGKLTIVTALNTTPIEIYGSEGGTQADNVSGHNLWIG
jgi:hypothetical protein